MLRLLRLQLARQCGEEDDKSVKSQQSSAAVSSYLNKKKAAASQATTPSDMVASNGSWRVLVGCPRTCDLCSTDLVVCLAFGE